MDDWILIQRGSDKLLMAMKEPSDHYDYAVVVDEDHQYRYFPDRAAAENWAIDALMEIRDLREIGIFREIRLSR